MTYKAIDIFISYSRDDVSFIDKLRRDLSRRGYQLWIDRHNLYGGDKWVKEVQEAIDQCRVLILIMSPSSLKSRYVEMELQYAFEKKKHLIPIIWIPSDIDIMLLTGIQRIGFGNYKAGLSALITALNKHDISPLNSPKIPIHKKAKKSYQGEKENIQPPKSKKATSADHEEPQDNETFDIEFAKMQEAIKELEVGDVSLEEAMRLFKQGVSSAVTLNNIMEQKIQRIQAMRENDDQEK